MDTISPTPDAVCATIVDVTTESFMADVIEASAPTCSAGFVGAWCGRASS